MTRIRYMKDDPRAGRVVNLEPTLAKRLIDDGVAEEVGDDVQSDAAVLSDSGGDGSSGDTLRPPTHANAGADETTTLGMTGTLDEETDGRKATGAKANKAAKGGDADK